MNARWPGAIEIAAQDFDPEQLAATGGAGVNAEFENWLIGGPDVDAVLACGKDDKREIAGLAGRGDGLTETSSKMGELLAGEAVGDPVLNCDDVGRVEPMMKCLPVAGSEAFAGGAAWGVGHGLVLGVSGGAEDDGYKGGRQYAAMCPWARHDSIVSKATRTVCQQLNLR